MTVSREAAYRKVSVFPSVWQWLLGSCASTLSIVPPATWIGIFRLSEQKMLNYQAAQTPQNCQISSHRIHALHRTEYGGEGLPSLFLREQKAVAVWLGRGKRDGSTCSTSAPGLLRSAVCRAPAVSPAAPFTTRLQTVLLTTASKRRKLKQDVHDPLGE